MAVVGLPGCAQPATLAPNERIRQWDDKKWLEWIEVEASKRRKSDADRLAHFIVQALCDPHIDSSHLWLEQITLVFPYSADDLSTLANAQLRLKWILKRTEAAFATSIASAPPDYDADAPKDTLYDKVGIVMMDVSAKLVPRHIALVGTLATFATRKGRHVLYLELANTMHPKNAHERWVTWLVDEDKRVIPKDPRL